ncbi:MAG TPA: hypothetical protein VM165_15615 [Planctomycetaceae bacterium]|nr:hypothetical protein [Planctomycetaceae bacterium]
MRAANSRMGRVLLVLAACALAGGCGQQTYEARLNESRNYFAYVQKLDANLAPAWKLPPVEELRVPLQFREIKKPAQVKNEEGKLVDPEIDPRQPDYLSMKIPGLWGTWEAPFNVVVDGQPASRKGYLYCVSNASMLLKSDEAARAPDFTRELLVLIAEKLSVPQLDFATAGERQTHPRSQGYSVQNNFDVFRFQGDSLRIDGVPYAFEIYAHYQGPVQAALVLVRPLGIDSTAKLDERVMLMLERFKVSSKAPMGAAKAAGGATPAGPAPSTGF